MLAGLLLAIPAKHGLAAEDWNLCRVPSFEYVERINISDVTEIQAQTISSEDGQKIRFSGDVTAQRAEQSISADEITIDKTSSLLEASGNVIFEDPDYRLKSTRIQLLPLDDSARFEYPEFQLINSHASGQADEILKLDESVSLYSNLVYTSCDPQARDWHLRADEMIIDNDSGRGTARGTILYFKEVPFLYLPWFQFPIDDRRLSGLLTPRVGYAGDDGASIVLPIYWNMAENYDATITPAWFSKRGLQLNTENRYLFAQNQGQVDLSYLDDDVFAADRWFGRWQHSASYANDVEANLLLAKVSDGQYFDDFRTVAPEYNDTRHLERHFSVSRFGSTWQTELLWQDYQTLNPDTAIEDRPYDRLPSFTLDGTPDIYLDNVDFQLHSELASFEREQSVTGTRAHIVPALASPSSSNWYFFNPELQLAFTDYQLDNTTGDDSIQRGIPTLGIDSGLTFERLAGSQKQWLQTLEPRLYFLYTPYEDQSDIPDFDTSLASSTYDNLFRNNRFVGADRIGDANQATLGLGSRMYQNETGNELMYARVGQTFYFSDRRVSLDGVIEDASKSDAIAEIDLWPNPKLKLSGSFVYAQALHELSDRNVSLNYSDAGFAANIGYYFTADELEQAMVSVVYPVNERWTLVGKYQHSLLFDKPVENLFGLSYESCCWGIKILAGQIADELDDFAETDNSIYFELTLKGLSQAGDDVDSRLRDAISGYSSNF